MIRLDGKVGIVIGGASGIGEATARALAQAGAHVVVADIDDARGFEVASSIGDGIALYKRTDVTSEEDVHATISTVAEKYGRLDCLSNNAAAGTSMGSRPVENIPIEAYEHTMKVFVRGVFLSMKHAAPIMIRQGSGSIINTASVAAFRAGFGTHIYSAAKAAIIQLTRSVAVELGESGVRANCICPGGVATPFLAGSTGLLGQAAERSMEHTEESLSIFNPLKQLCRPEDIAQAVLWLASEEASFVNGHSLVVDGGVSCGRLWSLAQQNRKYLISALKSGNF